MDVISEMSTLLETLYASFGEGDTSAWERSLAPDVILIGTDQAEWWQGRDNVVPMVRAQMNEMHSAGISLLGGDPQVAASADTVWVADRPTMRLGDGTEVALRLTLVATQAGEELLIKHMHLSVGAPNEEVVKQTLTV